MSQGTNDQALQLALGHHQAGRLAEAERIYRDILSRDPRHAGAMHLLGVIASQAGHPEAAVELIRNAIVLMPNMADFHQNLGEIYRRQKKTAEAILSFQRALDLNPNLHAALGNLGICLADQGKIEEAIACYRKSISLQPDFPEAHFNLGNVLSDQGKLEEAMDCYRRAIEYRPEFSEAANNLGNALKSLDRKDEAEAAYRSAMAIKPYSAVEQTNVANILKDQGNLDEALVYYDRAIQLDPASPLYLSNRIVSIQYHPAFDAAAQLREQLEWDRRFGQAAKGRILPHRNDRSPDRRLRVGFVSPDFRDHVVGRNVLPIFREFDRSHFEFFCYTDLVRADGFTALFKGYSNGWREIKGLTADEVANRVREDGIDILFDLALHASNSRLPVFSLRPAPVQVAFAGYPSGTGLEAMDYRLTDPYLDPPGETDQFYREKSIRLPHSFWCYDPEAMMCGMPGDLDSSPLPAASAGYVTFGCLNNFCKVTPQVISLWARVLKAVPGSKLIIYCSKGNAERNLLAAFDREGIEADRIEPVAPMPRGQYLRQYQRIDIGLDTFPYNGHTTSLDSMWMGVPVVTLVGRTSVGRAGLSQLSNLAMTDLAARTEDEYVSIARALSLNRNKIKQIRISLRENMKRSPLCDAVGFTRGIESALRNMWRAWCSQSTPLK